MKPPERRQLECPVGDSRQALVFWVSCDPHNLADKQAGEEVVCLGKVETNLETAAKREDCCSDRLWQAQRVSSGYDVPSPDNLHRICGV